MHRKMLEWYTLLGRNVVGSVKEDKFLHTSISFAFPTSMDYVIICLYSTYLGSRAKMDSTEEPKKKGLCIHAGGHHFYPGSRKGNGWHCTQMWAGTTIRCPCNMTSSMAGKRRYWAISCAGDPVFGLSEAQWGILLESEMKKNKMSLWKLNLNINTNWIRG